MHGRGSNVGCLKELQSKGGGGGQESNSTSVPEPLMTSSSKFQNQRERKRDRLLLLCNGHGLLPHLLLFMCRQTQCNITVKLVAAVSSSRVQQRQRRRQRQWQRSLQHLIYILSRELGMKRRRSIVSHLGISPYFFHFFFVGRNLHCRLYIAR